jgi:hypothetical protein
LRKVLEEQFTVLAGELATLQEQELKAREAEQRETLRGELAESLNQAVRLLRQSENFQQLSAVLADSSTSLCKVFAVFSIEGDRIRAERGRGLPGEAAERFTGLEFPASEAAAFAAAIESGDPVVVMTSPRAISAALARIFAHQSDDRAYLLPLAVRGRAVGVMYASGAVEMAPLELLAQAAALVLETRVRPPEPARKPDLVNIQGSAPAVPERQIPASWMELSAADQAVHLRAQHFARVQVAGMRLFSLELVKQGRASKDLYGSLQKEMDAAREMYRQFLTATPTMVDYFHIELLRILANDDAALLGGKYPGPLA